jgi:hypothetical protein
MRADATGPSLEFYTQLRSAPQCRTRKRHRSMANARLPVAKLSLSARQRRFDKSRKGTSLSDALGSNNTGSSTFSGNLTVKKFLGDCPPYNDKACWVSDPFERKAYMVGGERPGEKYNCPTSDFYCLDTRSMTWKNLSVCRIISLIFILN